MSIDLMRFSFSLEAENSSPCDTTQNRKLSGDRLERFSFDDQYVARLRSRDPEILDHFHAHFRVPIRAKLRSQFRWDEADDLAQDVFVAALEGIDGGAPRDSNKLPAYMVGICKNVARRKVGNIVKSNTIDIAGSDFPGHEASAEDCLISKSVVRGVQKVLRTLSARDREVIIREFYYGQDRIQASRELGVSRDRFRLILCRALQRFGTKWNDA